MKCEIVPVVNLDADVHEKLFHLGMRPLLYLREDGERVLAYLLDDDGLWWGVKDNRPASDKKV